MHLNSVLNIQHTVPLLRFHLQNAIAQTLGLQHKITDHLQLCFTGLLSTMFGEPRLINMENRVNRALISSGCDHCSKLVLDSNLSIEVRRFIKGSHSSCGGWDWRESWVWNLQWTCWFPLSHIPFEPCWSNVRLYFSSIESLEWEGTGLGWEKKYWKRPCGRQWVDTGYDGWGGCL